MLSAEAKTSLITSTDVWSSYNICYSYEIKEKVVSHALELSFQSPVKNKRKFLYKIGSDLNCPVLETRDTLQLLIEIFIKLHRLDFYNRISSMRRMFSHYIVCTSKLVGHR